MSLSREERDEECESMMLLRACTLCLLGVTLFDATFRVQIKPHADWSIRLLRGAYPPRQYGRASETSLTRLVVFRPF